MRHFVLTRSAYGPSWSLDANRRRLELSRAVTVRSLASQGAAFRSLVLLHSQDPLLSERRRLYSSIGADFLYLDATGTSAEVAWAAYHAGWAEAIGSRDDTVAMTRLDDDDGFAPWALAAVQTAAQRVIRRTALVLPVGVRVWDGGYTLVRHTSNAMQTLVTPPGDTMTVYDYGHRKVRAVGAVKMLAKQPAWLWSRHPDSISGWRWSDRPLTPDIMAMFDVDWSVFGPPHRQPKATIRGWVFR